MEYEFYVDTFFLLNLFTDALLLLLLKRLLQCTATHVRVLFGGVFGAGAACALTIVPGIDGWLKLFLGYGLISMCMIKISFRQMDLLQVCQATVYLYVCSFVFGGLLHFLMVQFPLFRKYGIGMLGVCMIGALTYGGSLAFYERQRQKRNGCLVPVTVIWKDRKKKLWALVDTGNSLYEPIGGKPVSVLEREAVGSLFFPSKPEVFRAIPFHSIGKEHGILEGYQLTELIIRGQYETIRVEKPMIGLFDKSISNNGAYQMILHPALTKKQEESV